ncbi:septum site-determining protein MinC [Sulfobacillus thermosulfidooxidans]|uniref:septum site-determining protein MinC n=1 Tax=Sulfobacillus thermosulfidooxidans TaxID=28034 RepID=UPI000412166D|nr:septum site-determining protein MinC [Sulfobacillus thermosulfidooxidans]
MELKGDRRGLHLLATDLSNEDGLVDDLVKTLNARHKFLGTATIYLEVNLPLTPSLFQRVAEVFSTFPNLTLKGIIQTDPSSVIPLEAKKPPSPPLIVRHTVRSGQQIMHQGDIIVIGDVNPGATIIASGDVMVFGWLRGTVYAGQPGDRARHIYALRLQPAQIKIGDVIALGDGHGEQPEYAHIEEGTVVVQSWDDVRLPEVVTQESKNRRIERRASHLSH